jgi:hypothetical protein
MDSFKSTLTCKLTTPELQKRRATVIAELKTIMIRKEEIQDGWQFTFDSSDETLQKLLEFVKSERLCCDFFAFQLSVSGEHATLAITGPEGTKEFLIHEVGF